jgi:hypothetical protein
VREFVQVAAQIQQEGGNLPITDTRSRAELLEAAAKYEQEAQNLRDALREWRKDIN